MPLSSLSRSSNAHVVQSSVAHLLAPHALSEILGRAVSNVTLAPFSSVNGRSGSTLQSVLLDGERCFVLKRIRADSDLAMQLTADHHVRSVALWRDGVLDALPTVMVHGITGCARDGDGWAILLDDFTGHLLPAHEERISEDTNSTVLDALAAMHAAFLREPSEIPSHESLCSLASRAASLSPLAVRPYARDYPLAQAVLDGWALLSSVVSSHVVHLIEALQQDVTPLCAALERYPQTLLHGDWHPGNLGLMDELEPRVVVLDWGLATTGPPAIDLAEYLAVGSMRLPGSKDETINAYRRSLCIHLGARFDASWWTPQLELALLGEFLRLGWNKALVAHYDPDESVRHRERAEIAWWSEHAILGARWL
jgi:Phosphotransferase enzyme family